MDSTGWVYQVPDSSGLISCDRGRHNNSAPPGSIGYHNTVHGNIVNNCSTLNGNICDSCLLYSRQFLKTIDVLPPSLANGVVAHTPQRVCPEDCPSSHWQGLKVSFMDTTPDHPSPEEPYLSNLLEVKVDIEGDLVLVSKSKAFLVSGKAMAMASPVFDQELRTLAHFLPGPAKLRILCMDDTLSEALEVILNIIHHKGGRIVPARLSLDELSRLAVIVERYSLAGVVRSWAYRWLRTVMPFQEKIQSNKAPKFMELAWVFEDEGTFEHMSRWVIRNAHYKSTGFGQMLLIDPEGNALSELRVPQNVISEYTT